MAPAPRISCVANRLTFSTVKDILGSRRISSIAVAMYLSSSTISASVGGSLKNSGVISVGNGHELIECYTYVAPLCNYSVSDIKSPNHSCNALPICSS